MKLYVSDGRRFGNGSGPSGGANSPKKTGDWGGVPRSWTVCDDNDDDDDGGGGGGDDDAILTSSRNLAVKSA